MTDEHLHPIWQLLDRLQMDNRAQAAKLIELRSFIANLDLPALSARRDYRNYDPPKDPVDHIRRMIHNGAIPDGLALEAELRAHGIQGDQADEIRALIPTALPADVEPHSTNVEPGTPAETEAA